MNEALYEVEVDYQKETKALYMKQCTIMDDKEKETLEKAWRDIAMERNFNEPIYQVVITTTSPEKKGMLTEYREVQRRKFIEDRFMPLSEMELERLRVNHLQTTEMEGDDDGILMRNMALTTKQRLFPTTGNFVGTLHGSHLERLEEKKMHYVLHMEPYLNEIYPIDEAFYDWKKLFGRPLLQNYGRAQLLHTKEGTKGLIDAYHYCVMTMDEIKVLLLANYNKRSENYEPKNYFSSPMKAARWHSYLNERYGEQPGTKV